MNARKFWTGAGIVAVAGVAGAISYRHQEHLAATHGQGALAVIWPLCIDGLVTVTALAISTDRADGHLPRRWALVGFWTGVLVSVTTNWLATSGGIINHCVSAFPALAFLLAIESLSSKPRAGKPSSLDGFSEPETRSPVTAPPNSSLEVADKARSPRRDSNAVRVAKAAARNPGASSAQLAAKLGLSDATVRRYLKSDQPSSSSSGESNDSPEVDVINVGRAPSLVDLLVEGDVALNQKINGHDVLSGVDA